MEKCANTVDTDAGFLNIVGEISEVLFGTLDENNAVYLTATGLRDLVYIGLIKLHFSGCRV